MAPPGGAYQLAQFRLPKWALNEVLSVCRDM